MRKLDELPICNKTKRDRGAFIDHLVKRLGVSPDDARKILAYMDRHKIINRRSPEKAMIREGYYAELRNNGFKVRETIMSLAVKYDVSISFVSGIIYDRDLPPHKF